jgi:hypothetical protein
MKDGTNVFIWLILVAALIGSCKHIVEAIRKRDAEALGEGIGATLFCTIGIVLKAYG